MSIISLQNIGKAYRSYGSEWKRFASWLNIPIIPLTEHWVLRNINFDISPGETVGIVGKNGAGKSTLLKLITGTLHPTEGQMLVNGRIAAILELGMGFNQDFTGRQNVYHTAGLMGFTNNEITQFMPEIEAFAEIGDYFDKPARIYSSGMYARVAFAIATAVKPDLLIVDEALSVGDSYFQAKCYERIARYKKEGMALILVTHSAGDIVNNCERAIMLKDGVIAQDGHPRDVTNYYLDDLFGKSMETKIIALDDEHHVLFAKGGEDLFHTRPGYRKEEYSWGHGGAVIIDYLTVVDDEPYPNHIVSNAKTDFYFKVRFDQDFEQVVLGFLIKTIDGIFLYGTNSSLTDPTSDALSARRDDIKVFKFSLPIMLNHGSYLVSFGVSKEDQAEQALVPIHRRYDAVMIHVVRMEQFWGVVDLAASFEITDRVLND